MSVKSLKRQLAAAIVMVLVAIIALGSSTFAWFASNNEVKATGMNITAVTEGANLEVSFSTTFTDGTIAVNYAGSGAELKPTHYVTATDKSTGNYKDNAGIAAGNWAHAFSNSYTDVSTTNTYANATVVDAVGTLGATESSTDWALVVPVYLRLNPQSKITMTNIKATAEITHSSVGEAAGMTTAGRVAFIDGVNATDKTVVDGKALDGTESNKTTTANVCENITAAGDSGMKLVYAVIYFDGDDTSCTSEKFDTDEYTVNLTFTGTEGEAIS